MDMILKYNGKAIKIHSYSGNSKFSDAYLLSLLATKNDLRVNVANSYQDSLEFKTESFKLSGIPSLCKVLLEMDGIGNNVVHLFGNLITTPSTNELRLGRQYVISSKSGFVAKKDSGLEDYYTEDIYQALTFVTESSAVDYALSQENLTEKGFQVVASYLIK